MCWAKISLFSCSVWGENWINSILASPSGIGTPLWGNPGSATALTSKMGVQPILAVTVSVKKIKGFARQRYGDGEEVVRRERSLKPLSRASIPLIMLSRVQTDCQILLDEPKLSSSNVPNVQCPMSSISKGNLDLPVITTPVPGSHLNK